MISIGYDGTETGLSLIQSHSRPRSSISCQRSTPDPSALCRSQDFRIIHLPTSTSPTCVKKPKEQGSGLCTFALPHLLCLYWIFSTLCWSLFTYTKALMTTHPNRHAHQMGTKWPYIVFSKWRTVSWQQSWERSLRQYSIYLCIYHTTTALRKVTCVHNIIGPIFGRTVRRKTAYQCKSQCKHSTQ